MFQYLSVSLSRQLCHHLVITSCLFHYHLLFTLLIIIIFLYHLALSLPHVITVSFCLHLLFSHHYLLPYHNHYLCSTNYLSLLVSISLFRHVPVSSSLSLCHHLLLRLHHFFVSILVTVSVCHHLLVLFSFLITISLYHHLLVFRYRHLFVPHPGCLTSSPSNSFSSGCVCASPGVCVSVPPLSRA